MDKYVRMTPALVPVGLALLLCAPSLAQQPNAAQNPAATLEVNVNRVLVPVVVRDKQGRVVGDLKETDFQVFDNDKPRPISAFRVERRAAREAGTEGSQPPGAQNAAPPAPALPDRITVFLFDDMHLSYQDLAYAKQAGVKALAAALTGPDVAAVVSMSGKTNSGLTRDAAKLQDAIVGLQLQGLNRAEFAACPYIDYYQADLIENKRDMSATQDAIAKVLKCEPSLDPVRDSSVIENTMRSAVRRAMTLGYQDVQETFATLAEIVRRMAPMPGQRTLILVSPGFLSIEPAALNAESRIIDLAAQSNVTISAIDARGVYSGIVGAGEKGSGQIVEPMRQSAMTQGENVMGELADGASGTFFHNRNDLEAGLKGLAEAPEVVYLLELSLDQVKPDGTYHRLRVKVDRDGVQLQARRGYFLPKPEKSKK